MYTVQAGYETGAGTYKHIYFNATLQTWIIWTFTLIYVIAVYESAKYITALAVRDQAGNYSSIPSAG